MGRSGALSRAHVHPTIVRASNGHQPMWMGESKAVSERCADLVSRRTQRWVDWSDGLSYWTSWSSSTSGGWYLYHKYQYFVLQRVPPGIIVDEHTTKEH